MVGLPFDLGHEAGHGPVAELGLELADHPAPAGRLGRSDRTSDGLGPAAQLDLGGARPGLLVGSPGVPPRCFALMAGDRRGRMHRGYSSAACGPQSTTTARADRIGGPWPAA